MEFLEVKCAVRRIYTSLGAEGLTRLFINIYAKITFAVILVRDEI